MKRLLNITKDLLLFSFLILILLLPLLVSFNLDPKLKDIETPVVAGVSDSTETKASTIHIEENFSSSGDIQIINTSRQGSKYSLKLKISGIDHEGSALTIGNLINQTNAKANYSINLLSDPLDLSNSIVLLKADNEESYLFDGNDFQEANIELDPKSKKEMKILFNSQKKIQYTFDVKIEIKPIY